MANNPDSACFGKHIYSSRRDARGHLKKMIAHGIKDGKTQQRAKRKDFDAYDCPFCSFWHIGHKPEWAKQSPD